MATDREQLQAGIAALEAQRALLGDAVAEAALAPLRTKLATLPETHHPAPAQTLKQVTILFLDVVGSTTLSQHLDPEEIHAVMDGALVRCTAIVGSYRGKVLQYAGDSLLAVFGADEVREDDPERAVHAGLALLEEGRHQDDLVKRQHGREGLTFRVGLHTGSVLLGGGVDAEGSIRGIAVSVAARMEQIAKAGTVLVTAETMRLAEGYVQVKPLGAVPLKGLDTLIDAYEKKYDIEKFDLTIDWGWFWFFTKPLFWLLEWLYVQLGNFGLSILVLTVIVKAVFFPLANKSYAAMSKMKALQPEMEKLKERYGEDRQRMNQELMQLYRREKVNPAAGCLPIVVQIPVFFALYKVLYTTIEMRHQPFFGWIKDLSAPDPLTVLTGFGLIHWQVPEFLHFFNIGLWPLIMGVTMYMQQKLNPAPTDPVQARVFQFLPILFTFMLGSFAAGLVIYWAWSNTLSIAQQYTIMRRHGTPIGKAKPKPAVATALPAPAAAPAEGGGGGGGKKGGKGSSKKR